MKRLKILIFISLTMYSLIMYCRGYEEPLYCLPGSPREITIPNIDIETGLWSEKQSGLFGIYNNIYEIEINNARKTCPFFPYSTKDIWTNAYPRIFYLNIKPEVVETVDTLKYNWQYDEIISICHDDELICESMMWSSCDTLYTKGNNITRENHGADIGNSLYDSNIIDELRTRQCDTLYFKSEINGIYRSRKGFISFNYYCKIIIRNGKITSYFTHIGTLTKQQYRALPEEEKACVKLPKCKHNSDL